MHKYHILNAENVTNLCIIVNEYLEMLDKAE